VPGEVVVGLVVTGEVVPGAVVVAGADVGDGADPLRILSNLDIG